MQRPGHWRTSERLDTPMYASNSSSQNFIALTWHHEASFFNHALELLLSWELLNALHKVLIAISVPSNKLANQRYCAKAPSLIDFVEEAVVDMTKFETCKHTARL